MPRANRQFAHHPVWHITQRCHNKQFLLKFVRDRRAWRMWLYEARRRYGLSILNYIVTSNHVHLIVACDDEATVSRALQLVAGRTAQDFNRRKARHGAFWEDRYHSVPIQDDAHLIRCLVYVDLNMVRAGVVDHPAEWELSGYNEIQYPRKRYRLIDTDRLCALTVQPSLTALQHAHRGWVAERLSEGALEREKEWTESNATTGATAARFWKAALRPAVTPKQAPRN